LRELDWLAGCRCPTELSLVARTCAKSDRDLVSIVDELFDIGVGGAPRAVELVEIGQRTGDPGRHRT
jgi:hypothetical protein